MRRIHTSLERVAVWYEAGLPENALEDDEFFVNRDPEFAKLYGEPGNVGTVPRFVGGDPSGAVSIERPGRAGPGDARRMHVPEEEGPGYEALVRRSPHGRGWDVLEELPYRQARRTAADDDDWESLPERYKERWQHNPDAYREWLQQERDKIDYSNSSFWDRPL